MREGTVIYYSSTRFFGTIVCKIAVDGGFQNEFFHFNLSQVQFMQSTIQAGCVALFEASQRPAKIGGYKLAENIKIFDPKPNGGSEQAAPSQQVEGV